MDDLLSIPTLLALIPLLPLAGAGLAVLCGIAGLGRFAQWPVVAGIGLAFVASVPLLNTVFVEGAGEIGYEATATYWTWAAVPDAGPTGVEDSAAAGRTFQIDVTLRADALTAIMLAMVTFIATLVAIYAGGYMHGDPGYWRFFSYVGLFVFSMTMLVSVSNFLLLFVFWEAVGLCSYLLIGFWYEKPEAADAGKKAFLVNRIGDFGFMIGVFLIWMAYGTLNFHDAGDIVGVLSVTRIDSLDYVGGALGTAICLMLLLGACGKSAQFPLHVWLPDAMEGPTPVSALIHAATMVTAGVYMVARCIPLFLVSPEAQLTVSIVGAFTALLAGLIALTQNDLKRVLAYSTVSQLGYMFLALGTGSYLGVVAGMFHLFTHAFFKALLFLGSGSVMHAMGNVIDMRRFSGLRHLMPWTCYTFLIGSLALAGFPFFSGFYSKDSVLAAVEAKAESLRVAPSEHAAAHEHPHTEHGDGEEHAEHAHPTDSAFAQHFALEGTTRQTYASVYTALYLVGLFTAFLTAFYTFRAFFMTFFGEERVPEEAGDHAHESPWSMVGPLVVLAVFAVFVGYGSHWFFAFISSAPPLTAVYTDSWWEEATHFHWDVAIMGTVAAVLGILLSAYFYIGGKQEATSAQYLFDLEWLRPSGQGYLPSPYEFSYYKFFLDEVYAWLVVRPLKWFGDVLAWLDRALVDGVVNLVGGIPPLAGLFMRSLQIGLVPFYALVMVLGLLALAAMTASNLIN